MARGPVGRLVRAFNAAANEIEARTAGLDQDRQQLLVVLGAMAEAVIAVDLRRRLLFANASANRLFGLDTTSVGRLVPELIRSPQVQDAVEATLRLAVPAAYEGELTLPGRDPSQRGNNRFLSVRGNPLPGQPSTGAVFVFHDVTELRRLERMRQDFVANASHELKTPLASIKAYTETLLDWALYDETVNARFLKRIDEQAERLNQLILDLLSLARIESGQEIFEHAPLYLVPVLESCVESHRDRAQTKNLNLAFDPGGLDDETMVLADEEAIRQIVDNLVDNAIKYTPEGGSVSVICHSDRNSATHRGRRHRHRHPPGRLASHLRTFLPRRQGPQPGAGRNRAGAVDRQAPDAVDRRPDRRDQPGGLGLQVYRSPAPVPRPGHREPKAATRPG